VSAESEAAPAGDRGCGAAELGRSWSCSRIATVAEVDRRRAAPLATCEERVDHEQGSSLAARERCPGERTPEAGSSWQSGENGGGLPIYRVGKRESASRHLGLESVQALSTEHLSMEGVSDRETRSPLTRGRGKRSWSPKARGQPRVGGTTGDVRGHSRSTTGEENAPMGRPPARAARRHAALKGYGADHRVARSRSWICAVKRRPTGVGLPQGGPAPRRRTAHRVGARARESAVGLRTDGREVPARSTRRKSRAR